MYVAAWALKEYLTEKEILFFSPILLRNCQKLNINTTKQWLQGDRRRADKYLKDINMEEKDLFIKIKGKKLI